MSYPINDKAKATAIRDSFNSKVNSITQDNKDYPTIITNLRKTTIDATLRTKLKDDMFREVHAFEEMPCNHTDMKKNHVVNCPRCQYNKREIEAENLINSLDGMEQWTIKDKDGISKTLTLNKLTIVRGKYDDVVGYSWEWA